MKSLLSEHFHSTTVSVGFISQQTGCYCSLVVMWWRQTIEITTHATHSWIKLHLSLAVCLESMWTLGTAYQIIPLAYIIIMLCNLVEQVSTSGGEKNSLPEDFLPDIYLWYNYYSISNAVSHAYWWLFVIFGLFMLKRVLFLNWM